MSDLSETVMPLDQRWTAYGLTMEWFIEKAAWIGRDSGSPGSIDYFFDAAGRLLKHCGFDYILLSPMCFHAIIGLEARLRFSYEATSKDSFQQLLNRAVDERLVTDDAFSSPKPLPKSFLKKIGEPQPATHAEKLAVLLPKLRNDYFHGSFLLAPELLPLALDVREISDALTKTAPTPP
jgi:hypothetical protein